MNVLKSARPGDDEERTNQGRSRSIYSLLFHRKVYIPYRTRHVPPPAYEVQTYIEEKVKPHSPSYQGVVNHSHKAPIIRKRSVPETPSSPSSHNLANERVKVKRNRTRNKRPRAGITNPAPPNRPGCCFASKEQTSVTVISVSLAVCAAQTLKRKRNEQEVRHQKHKPFPRCPGLC